MEHMVEGKHSQADLPAPDGPINNTFIIGSESSDAILFVVCGCVFDPAAFVERDGLMGG